MTPIALDLAEVLVAHNLITRTQQRECLQIQQQQPGKTLADIVVERGLCTREAIQQAVARYNSYAVHSPSAAEAAATYDFVNERRHANSLDIASLAEELARDPEKE